MYKISIIVTTYNSQNFISKTLTSILNQEGRGTLFTLELLVVDDCSSDGTTEIIQSFPVIFFSNENNSGGPNKGRNIGLKNATGDYICISDHDDIWYADRIIKILPYFDKVPIVTSGYQIISDNGQVSSSLIRSDEGSTIFKKNELFLKKLIKSPLARNTYPGSMFFHRQLKKIAFEELYGVVDYDWVLNILHNNECIDISEELYDRVVDGSNLSLNEEYRTKDFYYSLMYLENWLDFYPKEVNIAFLKVFGTRARYYYLLGNMKRARFYFLKSNYNLKTLMYYLTSFWGSKYVKKNFKIF